MPKRNEPQDIIGLKSGKLTVTEYVGMMPYRYGSGNSSHYRCICECGNETIVARPQLVSGHTRSCRQCRMLTLEGNHWRYFCKNGESFIFSPEDYGLVTSHSWYISNHSYVCTRIGRKVMLLTHLIMGVQGGYVDHIDGDTLNNQRSNLRLASNQENVSNAGLGALNTSGYKGVSFYKSRNKYRSVIKVNYKQKHLGYFETPEEAAHAYDRAARFYFGEFACVNFPLPGEQGCGRSRANREPA